MFIGSAHASIINGTLNIGGNVTISSTGGGQIAFNALPAIPGQTFNINTSFGSFATLTGTGNEAVTLSAGAEPINVVLATPVANFLTFANDPNLSFTLTEVLGGVFGTSGCPDGPGAPGNTPAPGQVCSPPGTPYNLSNGTNSSSAFFDILGYFVTANDGVKTPAKGEFSAAFTADYYQTLLASIQTGSQVIPYGAQFVTVPEPGYGWMTGGFGAMLLGLSAAIRRKVARRS
jgi:hypothetical protein